VGFVRFYHLKCSLLSAESQPPVADKQLKVLIRSIRTILTRDPGPTDILTASYEAIFTACQAIVTVSQQGEYLYNDVVKIELAKSIGQLSRALVVSTEKGTAWITTFNKALAWIDQQIVRKSQCPNSMSLIFCRRF
jgi:hypothetical protein